MAFLPEYSVQRWSREHKARGHKARGQGQGHKKNPRPRTGMLEAKAKDTSASAIQKKRLHKNFSSDLFKKTFSKKFFKRFTKFYLFKKYCCPRAEDRPIFEDLRPRGQGQGLQNVSSRTPTLIRWFLIADSFRSKAKIEGIH